MVIAGVIIAGFSWVWFFSKTCCWVHWHFKHMVIYHSYITPVWFSPLVHTHVSNTLIHFPRFYPFATVTVINFLAIGTYANNNSYPFSFSTMIRTLLKCLSEYMGMTLLRHWPHCIALYANGCSRGDYCRFLLSLAFLQDMLLSSLTLIHCQFFEYKPHLFFWYLHHNF